MHSLICCDIVPVRATNSSWNEDSNNSRSPKGLAGSMQQAKRRDRQPKKCIYT